MMSSSLIYRASFYVMMTVATTILCGDATDSRLDWILPVAVAVAGTLAFFTVDQPGHWGMPRDLANLLAVGTLGLLYLEYKSNDAQMIRCLGHWMVYLQLIKYLLPKTAEDDWFLFLLGLTQVLIGAVINSGDTRRLVALLLGDAGRLGSGVVLPATREPPISAGARGRPGGYPASRGPLSRPLRFPLCRSDDPGTGIHPAAGRIGFSAAAAAERRDPGAKRLNHDQASDRV